MEIVQTEHLFFINHFQGHSLVSNKNQVERRGGCPSQNPDCTGCWMFEMYKYLFEIAKCRVIYIQLAIWLEWFLFFSSRWDYGMKSPYVKNEGATHKLANFFLKKRTRCFKVSRIKEPGEWLLTPNVKQVSGGNVTTRRVVLRRWGNSQPYIADGIQMRNVGKM